MCPRVPFRQPGRHRIDACPVFAASQAPAAFAATTQQNKMKECNASATEKKGDDRKKFMSECLKGS